MGEILASRSTGSEALSPMLDSAYRTFPSFLVTFLTSIRLI